MASSYSYRIDIEVYDLTLVLHFLVSTLLTRAICKITLEVEFDLGKILRLFANSCH